MIVRTVNFTVPGLPQGKGAARHTMLGHTYTPTKTRNYMAMVRDFALKAGATPRDCPCTMRIIACFPIPMSYSKKLQLAIRSGEVYYDKKPDTDNLSKIKDALIGVAFADDSLVWREEVTKFYSDTPRLEIIISYHETHEPGVLGYLR